MRTIFIFVAICALHLLASCTAPAVTRYSEPEPAMPQLIVPLLEPRIHQEIIPVSPTPGDRSPRLPLERHVDPFEYVTTAPSCGGFL